MDKHYLTPLFSPDSVVVLGGAPAPGDDYPHARLLRDALEAQTFMGTLRFVDLHASGRLADLAQARADLAIIALPPAEVPGALDIACRLDCRSVLVSSVVASPYPAVLTRRSVASFYVAADERRSRTR